MQEMAADLNPRLANWMVKNAGEQIHPPGQRSHIALILMLLLGFYVAAQIPAEIILWWPLSKRVNSG